MDARTDNQSANGTAAFLLYCVKHTKIKTKHPRIENDHSYYLCKNIGPKIEPDRNNIFVGTFTVLFMYYYQIIDDR